MEYVMLGCFTLVLGQVLIDVGQPPQRRIYQILVELTALLVATTPFLRWYILPIFTLLLVAGFIRLSEASASEEG